MNYGHWSVDHPFDTKDVIGFVYIITFNNGQKYIGAKRVWKNIKRPPATYKRGSKTPFIESDWRSYRSSSNEVVELEIKGIQISEMRIVASYDSWGKVLLCEALLQFSLDALRSEVYLNRQIEGLFTASCFDKQVFDDVARIISQEEYDPSKPQVILYRPGDRSLIVDKPTAKEILKTRSGWVPASLPPSQYQRAGIPMKPYHIQNNKSSEIIEIDSFETQYKVASMLDCPAGDLSRLRSGEILNIGDWRMKDARRVQHWKHKDKIFFTASEIKKAGLNKDDLEFFPAEDREEYRKRLAEL